MKKLLAIFMMLMAFASLWATLDPESTTHSFFNMKLSMANAYASGYAIFNDSKINRETILEHASDLSYFAEKLTGSNTAVTFPNIVIDQNSASTSIERKFYLFFIVYSDIREATITIDAPSLKSGTAGVYSSSDSYLPYTVSAQILAGNTARATINIDTIYSYLPINAVGDGRRKEEIIVSKPQSLEGSWAVIEITVKTDDLRNYPADVYSGAINFRYYELFKRW